MRLVLRKLLGLVGVAGILLVSLCVYAADDDILQFLPGIVKAQAQVNPVGTWTGPGSGSWGACACDLGGLRVVVTAGTRSGVYLVSLQTTGTATCDASCDMVVSFSNMPAVLVGNRLVFAQSLYTTMASQELMTSIDGELVITGSTANVVTKTFNFKVPYDASDKQAMAGVLGGALVKQ